MYELLINLQPNYLWSLPKRAQIVWHSTVVGVYATKSTVRVGVLRWLGLNCTGQYYLHRIIGFVPLRFNFMTYKLKLAMINAWSFVLTANCILECINLSLGQVDLNFCIGNPSLCSRSKSLFLQFFLYHLSFFKQNPTIQIWIQLRQMYKVFAVIYFKLNPLWQNSLNINIF